MKFQQEEVGTLMTSQQKKLKYILNIQEVLRKQEAQKTIILNMILTKELFQSL
jgi:hypothetical protein